MVDVSGTIETVQCEYKTWRGLMIREHCLLHEDGTETDLLENCKPYMKKQLKVWRS
ncbi:MAG: hypothetical protein ABFD07_16350 [Methanobacterium sp.]